MEEVKKEARGSKPGVKRKPYGSVYEKRIKKYLDDIYNWSRDGLSKRDICKMLNVSSSAYHKYERDNPELRDAYDLGRDHLYDDIEGSLFRSARGMTVLEQSLDGDGEILKQFKKQLAPNQRSIEYALNNRRPDKWRSDTKSIDISLSDKMKEVMSNLDAQDLKALATATAEEMEE